MRKNNPIVKEYRRLRKNILANIRRYKAQGAHVPIEVPNIPKKITEGSIRRLQKLTPSYIKERSTVIDPRTTEVITVKQKQIRQRKGYYKGYKGNYRQATDEEIEGWVTTVLTNYYRIIFMYPKKAFKVLNPWIEKLIDQYGATNIARMLQDAESNGIVIDYKIAYDDNLLADYQHRLIDYLPTPEEEKADLHNAIDESLESWEELE